MLWLMEKNVFDQPAKNNKVTFENIRKIITGQGGDYTRWCLLHHTYSKNYYKMIAIDLSKQQALDAGNTRIYFILEEAKETALDFSQGTVKVLWVQLHLIIWFLSV